MNDISIGAEKNVYKILQISDIQIIDSSQQRYKERLKSDEFEEWLPEKIDSNCFDIVKQIAKKAEPDLIICTGDQVYGQFDDTGRVFEKYVNFMDSLNIPWIPIFGNHDRESKKGIDWMCDRLTESPNCIFERGDTDGEGNFEVLIKKDGKAIRTFYFMDTFANNKVGLTNRQLSWLDEKIRETKRNLGSIKMAVVTHIQPAVFGEVLKKIGFNGSPAIVKTDDNLQMCLAKLKNPWDDDGAFWGLVKKHGIDSVIVAHEHCNFFSMIYDGVRLQYGLKSSVYDRNVYIGADGIPIGSYCTCGTPLVGGTVMDMDTNNGDFIKVKNIFYNDYDKLL